jgi:hypothetical protein
MIFSFAIFAFSKIKMVTICKNRISRIVTGRIGRIGKPMKSNSIFSYLAYPAVYDPAYPVFTNIALGIDSIRFFLFVIS